MKALQEFLLRYFFLPEHLAVWNLTVVIVNTASLFQLNILAAINITIAQMAGSNQSDKKKQLVRASAVCSEFVQQMILIAGVLVVAPMIWDLPSKYVTIILIYAGLTIFQTALMNLFVGFHESNGSFVRLGIVIPINAMIQLLLVYIGILEFHIIGLFLGMLLSTSLSLLVLLTSLKFLGMGKIQSPSFLESKKLITKGFKFRLSDIGTSVFYALDTLIASVVLTPVSLSFFITAKFCASLSSQALFAFSRINLIKLGNSIGGGREKSRISEGVTKQFFVVYQVLAPLLILTGAPLFKLVVPLLIPSYVASLKVLPFFLLSILCSSRALFIRNMWIQLGNWEGIAKTGVMALATSIPILCIGYYFLAPIDGVVLAKLIMVSQLPYAVLLIFMISKETCSLAHAKIRLFLFTLSAIGISVSLYLNGSFDAVNYPNFLSFTSSLGLGFVAFLPFLLVGSLAFKLFTKNSSQA